MDFVPGAEHAPPMPLMAPPGVRPHVNAHHLDMYIGKPVTLTGEILTVEGTTVWALTPDKVEVTIHLRLLKEKPPIRSRCIEFHAVVINKATLDAWNYMDFGYTSDKDVAEFMGNALFLADMCQDPRFKGSVL
ncbi:hypothetical protein OE88DRAFT_1649136 [Heliocybe sulcata]|uniref:Replication factor A protein 3 n=1 Tax=Heliocybe sulcata TaxID=5364 RepID=A0A5C3ML37_9AGAM|nr:hypothetical protein OE88DRAFT_1649136 [Heliocybe sulcata]